MFPVIQPRPGNALHIRTAPLNDRAPIERHDTWAQSASILPMVYGKQLDPKIMKEDPFYAISELFTLSAASEAQFLNMFENKINNASKTPYLDDKILILEELKTAMKILNRRLQSLEEIISVLKTRSSSRWPQAENVDHRRTAEAALECLLQDFEYLAGRAKSLTQNCESQIPLILAQSSLREARANIQQAAIVRRLIYVAIAYLPMIFIATLFGMNVVEFGVGRVPIWVYWSVTVPLSLVIVFLWWLFQSDRARRFIDKVLRREYATKSKLL